MKRTEHRQEDPGRGPRFAALVRIWRSERLRLFLSPILLFLDLLLLDGSLRLIHNGTGITGVKSVIPWGFTICWCLTLTALLQLLPRRPRQAATAVVGGLFHVLFLTHAIMRRAKGNFFSFSSLMYAADGFKFLDASYLQVRKLIWIVLVFSILVLVLSVTLTPRERPHRGRVILSLVLAAAGILGINLNREQHLSDRLQNHFNIYQNSLLYENFSNPNECLMLCGLYQYTLRDFCVTYGVYDRLNRISSADQVQELDAWYGEKELDPDNDWTGRFAGKNLILIQLEAIDTWMLNEQFMPNLFAIQRQSLDFTQNYTPLYSDAGTFNTEMIVNTGLVSPFVGATASMYSRNSYPYSLANLMREAGYTADSFHRSGPDVYNRGEIHGNWGYEHYFSGEEMGIERLDFDQELMRAYDQIVREEPFFSFIITYSGHGAYLGSDVSAAYRDMAASMLPEGTDEMTVHAMAHAWATDLFIGELYSRLEAEGRLEDTVLVFYADHYNYYVLDDALIMERKETYDSNLITRTPFFIYDKNTQPEKIEKVMSTIDILPTLVNLFGLDSDGRYYVGNDAFSDHGGYVIFKDFSWYDGETYWKTTAADGEQTDAIRMRNEELSRRLEMSWNTMKLNYLAG